jgi:hypothetical protein
MSARREVRFRPENGPLMTRSGHSGWNVPRGGSIASHGFSRESLGLRSLNISDEGSRPQGADIRLVERGCLLTHSRQIVCLGLINPKGYSRTDVSAIVDNEGVEPDMRGTGAG